MRRRKATAPRIRDDARLFELPSGRHACWCPATRSFVVDGGPNPTDRDIAESVTVPETDALALAMYALTSGPDIDNEFAFREAVAQFVEELYAARAVALAMAKEDERR